MRQNNQLRKVIYCSVSLEKVLKDDKVKFENILARKMKGTANFQSLLSISGHPFSHRVQVVI